MCLKLFGNYFISLIKSTSKKTISIFFNTSETIPIENGELMLGKWQDIHFIELDPGDEVYPLQERTIVCTFIEE